MILKIWSCKITRAIGTHHEREKRKTCPSPQLERTPDWVCAFDQLPKVDAYTCPTIYNLERVSAIKVMALQFFFDSRGGMKERSVGQ